jgi:hypothetical protein
MAQNGVSHLYKGKQTKGVKYMETNRMGGTCSTYGRELHRIFGQEVPKKLHHYEDLGTSGYLSQDRD